MNKQPLSKASPTLFWAQNQPQTITSIKVAPQPQPAPQTRQEQEAAQRVWNGDLGSIRSFF